VENRERTKEKSGVNSYPTVVVLPPENGTDKYGDAIS
jgi:hypothetical protein